MICHAFSEPVNGIYKHETVDFNEKLDYNKIKMSKLRLLLLGELFKHQNDVVCEFTFFFIKNQLKFFMNLLLSALY